MTNIDIKLFELDRNITEIRDVLNEIALTSTDNEDRLKVSEYLDKLIVEYMKLKYTLNSN